MGKEHKEREAHWLEDGERFMAALHWSEDKVNQAFTVSLSLSFHSSEGACVRFSISDPPVLF